MKKNKILILTPVLLIFFTLFFTGDNVEVSADFGITSIEHNSSPLVKGENLTVTVNFYDTTNISEVKLLICTLAPEFLCEPQPILMAQIEPETFEGKFLVNYDVGTQVGYHISIVYDNYTTAIIPETPTFLDMDVVEPLTDFFFFNAGIVQEKSDEAGCCGILGTVLAISAISLVTKRKKQST